MKKLLWFASILFILVVLPALYVNGKFASHIILTRASFSALPHWQADNHLKAFETYKASCVEVLKRNPQSTFGNLSYAGPTRFWQAPCRDAVQLTRVNDQIAKQFFEKWFQPYQLKNNYNPAGLFTGYYLPTLAVSLKPSKQFSTPIYALPTDLIRINLGQFKPELKGMVVTAQLHEGKITPYPDRAKITSAPLKNADVIAWTDSPIDLFFAQIQGSAIGILPNKQQIILSYAGGNGRPYKPIGKVLLQQHALSRDNISMQSIRDWLIQHPAETTNILNQNPSYTFFLIRPSRDVIGTEQVALTPGRSLAIDKKYIPLGAPLWLSTQFPSHSQAQPFNHLVVAQDTGGAINGLVRGDVYWGSGNEATDIAGHMQEPGQLWILLPRRIS